MDKDTLQLLYQAYGAGLYRYLYSLCGRRETAEDLLQETFLKAILALPDTHTNMRAWLYRVAHNLCVNEMKRRSREQPGDPPEQAEERDGTEAQAFANERSRQLYHALLQLRTAEREVLELQYFGGLSQKEIAAIVQRKPEQVRQLACRGKRKLRAYWEENGYDLS